MKWIASSCTIESIMWGLTFLWCLIYFLHLAHQLPKPPYSMTSSSLFLVLTSFLTNSVHATFSIRLVSGDSCLVDSSTNWCVGLNECLGQPWCIFGIMGLHESMVWTNSWIYGTRIIREFLRTGSALIMPSKMQMPVFPCTQIPAHTSGWMFHPGNWRHMLLRSIGIGNTSHLKKVLPIWLNELTQCTTEVL